jgi:signal transduction histidine kinase
MIAATKSPRLAMAAWVVCALTLMVAGTRFALAIVTPLTEEELQDPTVPGGGIPVAAFETLTLASIAIIGAVVASRQPRNPIGWILSSIALWVGVVIVASHLYWTLAYEDPTPSGLAVFCTWLVSWVWIFAMMPALMLFPLYFPSGRPPSPRWRWVEWVFVAAVVTVFVGTAFAPGELEEVYDQYPVANPVGPDGRLGDVVKLVNLLGSGFMVLGILAGPVSLVVRFRRSVDIERQQIKWVASAAVLFPILFIMPTDQFAGEDVGFAMLLFGLLILAVAVAFSILRYRLYDIDVVINKAVVFTALAGFITAVYAGVVVGLGRLLPVGEQNLGLAIMATALVAVAFEPVRLRVQHWANRLVYGKRATPYETLAAMTGKLGDSADPGSALNEAATLLAEGTGAAQAVVWVTREGWLVPRATAGDSVAAPAPLKLDGNEPPEIDGAIVQAVRHEGHLVGALSLAKRPGEGVSSADRRLLEELAGQAALLLANTRLRSRLSDRLEELRASRRRMLAAHDRARHALERDLHDGAQQELVALKVKLGLARTIATREEAPELATRLTDAITVADQAVDTLRDVARGIYPPLLETEGLAAALTAQARRADLAVTVLDRTNMRYSREIEATAFFCVREALMNASLHANAGHAHVELDSEDAGLTVIVSDDGIGFDLDVTPQRDGLTHMYDRADAAGGVLDVDSHPGRGTTITLSLPVTALEPAVG